MIERECGIGAEQTEDSSMSGTMQASESDCNSELPKRREISVDYLTRKVVQQIHIAILSQVKH